MALQFISQILRYPTHNTAVAHGTTHIKQSLCSAQYKYKRPKIIYIHNQSFTKLNDGCVLPRSL